MRSFKVMGRTEIIRWRIRGLWAVLALMLVYYSVKRPKKSTEQLVEEFRNRKS